MLQMIFHVLVFGLFFLGFGACLISSGFSYDCDIAKLTTGGLRKNLYVFNIDEIDRTQGDNGFEIDANGYVTDIYFTTYGLLYEFQGVKGGNQYTSDVARVANSGNVNFTQQAVLKLYDITPDQKTAIEDLAYAEVGVIFQDTSGSWLIFGRDRGLTITSAPKTSGENTDADTGRLITLDGSESGLEVTFFDTDASTTADKLAGYTV